MLRTILAYILGFIVPYFFTVFFALPLLIVDWEKYKFPPWLNFCLGVTTHATSTFGATFLFFWICTKLSVRPVYAMFVFLLLAKESNYRWRIKHYRKHLAGSGFNEPVNQIYEDLIGFVIGFSLALFLRGQLPLY